MSRRKQTKPQCLYMDSSPLISQHLQTDNTDDNLNRTTSLLCNVYACESCCAKFLTLSHLQEHQIHCTTKNHLLLTVSDNDPRASPTLSFTLSSPHQYIHEQRSDNSISPKGLLTENKESSPMSVSSGFEDYQLENEDKVGNGCTASVPLTSVSLSVLAEADSPSVSGKALCTSTNVLIENLQSTKVAVAQFSQETSLCSNAKAECNSDTCDNCSTATPRLIEQLVALQQQQGQQLRLIGQIQHQILLLASQNPNKSEVSSICQGTLDVSLINPLMTLSTHLSQQLAEAAVLTQSLANQSAGINEIKQSRFAVLSNHHDNTVLESKDNFQMTNMDKSECLSSKMYTYPSSPDSEQIDSLSPSHALADANQPHLVNNHSLPPSTTGNDILVHLPYNGKIVEDWNVLTAVTQQWKHKLPNMSSFTNKSLFDEDLFKHKCRFCAKVFGSDSALKIHLRSHTGERPYKCNICGNRFSTRGNLKVHFQRHNEKYPKLQMNPYPVPEYLDNVPTNAGIPYGMSILPDHSASKWLDSKPSVTNLPGLLSSSLPSLPSVIKSEMQKVPIDRTPCRGISALNGAKTFENSKDNSLKDFTTTDEASINTNSLSPLFFQHIKPKIDDGFKSLADSMKASETTKLQQLVENIDKEFIDPNECMVCHRVLSCQSALKMHYRTHTGERPFKCKICGRTFTTKGNLKTHYSIHRTMQPIKVQHSCPICLNKFTNAMLLQQHIRMHMVGRLPNETLPETCRESWESKQYENFSDETMEVTNIDFDTKDAEPLMDSLPYSTLCQTINTSGPKNQETNIRLDNGSMNGNGKDPISPRSRSPKSFKPVSDPFLNKSSSLNNCASMTTLQHNSVELTRSHQNLTKLTRPISSSWKQETSRSFACDVCNKTFTCQSALDIHYCSHTKEHFFICAACNQGFSTKANLKQHMLTHQQQDIQGLGLSEPANEIPTMENLISSKIKPELNSISIKVDKEPVLEVMTTLASPTPPRRTAKQHFCQFCGKTFSSSSALQIHERTHTGEKPFVCSICGRAFTTKGNLKVHMGTHVGNSAHHGCRFFVDGSLSFLKSSPGKVSDVTRSTERVGIWNGPALKNNNISVIQN